MFALRTPLATCVATALATLVVGTALSVSAPAAQAQSAAGTEPCVPVAIMGMRGSSENSIGETKYSPTAVSNGYEGAIVTRLLWGLTWHYGSNPQLAQVPVVGLSTEDGYRAASLDSGGFLAATRPGSEFWSSAIDGGAAAINKMDSFQAAQRPECAPTKWILIGYSQGAMVARWAFAEAPQRVASLYLMGDPFQAPNKVGNAGDGAGGTGVVTSMVTGDYTPINRYYDTRPSNAVELCIAGDVICDHTTGGSNWLAHLLYLLNPFDAAGAAAPLRDMILKALSESASARTAASATSAAVSANISVAAMPTLISAAGSRISGPATYEFDFDNDGSFEAKSTRPALARVFSTGPHTINVRVSNPSAQSATASYSFRTMSSAVAFGGASPSVDGMAPFEPSALLSTPTPSGPPATTPETTAPTATATPTSPAIPVVTAPVGTPRVGNNPATPPRAGASAPQPVVSVPVPSASGAQTKATRAKAQSKKAKKAKALRKMKKAKAPRAQRRGR